MEHAILEVVSDCYVESWRHLLKDIGLTNVFQYGVPSLGLPTMDLWSDTSEIRDRCFLLLLGNTLVPKNTCVSFIQSISHVRAAPQPVFGRNKSETFVLVLQATPTLPARHWHSTSFWTWSPRWSATTPCASWVSGIPKKATWSLESIDFRCPGKSAAVRGCADENWWTNYYLCCYALTVTNVWVEHGSTLWKANLHAHSRASRPIWHLHLWRSDNESEEDEANRAREAEDEKTRQIEDSDSTKKWDDRQGGHLHLNASHYDTLMYNI